MMTIALQEITYKGITLKLAADELEQARKEAAAYGDSLEHALTYRVQVDENYVLEAWTHDGLGWHAEIANEALDVSVTAQGDDALSALDALWVKLESLHAGLTKLGDITDAEA